MTVMEMPKIGLREQKKYVGKHVAIVKGKIVASGDTAKEAFQKARELYPRKRTEEIGLLFIPSDEMMIL